MGFTTFGGSGGAFSPNAFTTKFKNSSYTASSGERIISQGATITMPASPNKGDTIIVERVGSSSVEVQPNGTELIETRNEGYIKQDSTVGFISDGTNWYSIDGSNFLNAIPDSGLLHEWDTQALSATDGDTIDSLPDQQGTLDLPASGAPSYETTTNISEPAVFYDGSDDRHSDSSFGGVEDGTITIAFVIEPLRTNTKETFATVNHSGIVVDLRLDNGVWNVTFPGIAENTGGTYAANSTYAGVFTYDGSTAILDIGDTTPINTSSNTNTTISTEIQIGNDDGGRNANFHSHYASIYDDGKDNQTRQDIILGLESKFGFTSANA